MRCLNEDDKEQYKGDKSIITANLIADTLPSEFPCNGKHVSNLTEYDILAPGSTFQVLDGSSDIYMTKEENFCPDEGEIIGRYEIRIDIPSNVFHYGKYFDKDGNLVEQVGPIELNNPLKQPYTWRDITFRCCYDHGTPNYDQYSSTVCVASSSKNIILYNNQEYKAGDVIDQRGMWWRGDVTITMQLLKGAAQQPNWCKL